MSVPDLKEYYKQLWEVGDGSVSSSLVCGHHTDMVFVGRTPDINEDCQWGSIKLHKAVVMQVCPLLWTMMANIPEFEAKIVFPDFPLEVIKASVDLIYHGECKLSTKCDVFAIMSLSHTLGIRNDDSSR